MFALLGVVDDVSAARTGSGIGCCDVEFFFGFSVCKSKCSGPRCLCNSDSFGGANIALTKFVTGSPRT